MSRVPVRSFVLAAAAVLLGVALVATSAARGGPAAPSAELNVQADAVQPSGFPIQLRLTVKNVGTAPLRHSRAWPAAYPDAGRFRAEEIGPDGAGGPCDLSNGQTADALAGEAAVPPGGTLTLPVALGPLEPGVHAVVVRSAAIEAADPDTGKPVVLWPEMTSAVAVVEVRDDAGLARRHARALAAGVRAGDAFALHAVTIAAPGSAQYWLDDAADDDPVVARDAAGVLRLIEPSGLPDSAAGQIRRGVVKALAGLGGDRIPLREPRLETLSHLSEAAARLGTDDALEAVLLVARGRLPGWHVTESLDHLATFDAPLAAAGLREATAHADANVRRRAALLLGERRDPGAAASLRAVAADATADAFTRGRARELLEGLPALVGNVGDDGACDAASK